MPELPNAPALLAEVVLVDTVIDGASNTFRVRATLPNPDGTLPSGLRCRAELSDLPASVAGPLPAEPGKGPLPAVPAIERASTYERMALKVDTNLASMNRATTAAARRGKPQAAQNQ